jgi:hypothetical protein
MYRLSKLTWQQIQQADRHGMGSEKINPSSIRAQLPSISGDITFIALRFSKINYLAAKLSRY